MKFSLKFLLSNKQTKALKNTIDIIHQCKKDTRSIAHSEAAKKIMKLKIWQKALDFVKEN